MKVIERRRAIHLSLVTLVVAAAVICVWLGWNARRVDQRDFVLEAIEARGGSIQRVEFFRGPGAPPKPLPFVWSLLGAKPVESIALPSDRYTNADLEYARAMFPEADVRFYDGEVHRAMLARKGYVVSSDQEITRVSTLQADAESIWQN